MKIKEKKYEYGNVKIRKNKSKWTLYIRMKNKFGKSVEEYRHLAIKNNDTEWLQKHHEYDWKKIIDFESDKDVIKMLPIITKDLSIIYKKIDAEVIE